MSKLHIWAIEKYGKDKIKEKIESVITGTKEENLEIMRLRDSTDQTLKRLEKLVNEDKNIEYINSGSPLIEYSMRRLVLSYRFVVNSSLLLLDFDTQLCLINKDLNSSNNAFGNFLNELERFIPKNDKLIALLGNFNGNKIKASHKLYEEHTDPEEVNKDLRTYVQNYPITEILLLCSEKNSKIQEELVNKLGEYGVISIGPANEKELRKLMQKAK